MLRLLGVPEWERADGVRLCLPASLPACLLVYLACHGRWMEREALALAFWPDSPRDQALHKLRVNLHRVRQLLLDWEQEAALLSERSRVQLKLPLDLDRLRAAIAACDGPALLAWPALGWLEAYRIPGFANFWDWSAHIGQHWQQQWREAGARALEQGGDAPWTEALRQLLRAGAAMSDSPDEPDPGLPALPGRETVLAQLRDPRSPALAVLGEAGLGKSAVLRAAWPEAPLLQGREGLTQIPFRPVVELLQAQRSALRAALKQGDSELAPYRLDLARLMPELAPHEALPPLDVLTAKSRLLEALALVLEQQPSPTLLVDDLQWCDLATLDLLALLAHRGRLRWRAAARDLELGPQHQQWLDGLQRQGLLQPLALQGLGLPAVAELCARHEPGAAWSPARLAQLHSASAGNPFVLSELLRAGWRRAEPGRDALPPRVMALLQQRLQQLAPGARALVGAAAVLARPLPLHALATVAELAEPLWLAAAQTALDAQLLSEQGDGGLQCVHDLVRHAVLESLPQFQRQTLHRRAALLLAAREEGEAEPLAVAAHWASAQEPQTALAWMLRGATQLKLRGRYEEAQALWQRVAEESLDATQALQARLALAECDLLSDLPRGRVALEEVLAQVPAVAEPLQREQIEGQALAGLVDNRVFAGDMASARVAAARLRPLLPRLRTEERVHACEVLIELAMREPDIPAAWGLLEQIRRLTPRRPAILSFEGQIHWFAGGVRAARDAFELLLQQHADYCRGLTIENDLAVMLQALGELERAEQMARRSLLSWRGVAHTETLSLLVLGLTLSSAGRYDEAETALGEALRLGAEQGSALFQAEALVRRARLYWQSGQPAKARLDLNHAQPLLEGSEDPLRVSQYVQARWLTAQALGHALEPALLLRLGGVAERSQHPLVHVRLARLQGLLAQQQEDRAGMLQAAERQAALARAAGLQEALAEALLLQAEASDGLEPALIDEAAALAQRLGLIDLRWRAESLRSGGAPAAAEALARLQAGGQGMGFDAQTAARRWSAHSADDPAHLR